MDQIANFIISLKNAGNAGRDSVVLPYSKMKESIANVLMKEGFVSSVEKKTVKGKPALVIGLFLENRIPKIKGVERISKSSKRVYQKATELRAVKYGYGALVVSTPAGIMTGKEARKQKVGGEVLFSIW